MAKALFGHVGGVEQDLRMAAEMRRLRQRVRDLEDEVTRLQAAKEALTPQTVGDDMSDLIALGVAEAEPALT
jgi:hypothetical protein